MTEDIITIQDAGLKASVSDLARRCPQAVMTGLRAGAGYLASQARALMMRRVRGADTATTVGAFRGQRLADAVRVHNTARDLMVSVFLSIRTDMRSHWLNSGTAQRHTGRSRRKKQDGAYRGSVTPRRFFTDAISRHNEALRIMERAALSAVDKAWKHD